MITDTIQIYVNHNIVATAVRGDKKTADGGASKRAELLTKYKALQKQIMKLVSVRQISL